MAKAGKKAKRVKKAEPSVASETCFVMMSFSQLPKSYYEQVFAPAITAAGLAPRRADDIFLPSPIINDIWREVRNARIMLADLSFRNPNVMYELGLAHALGKPVVMLTQDMADVPFDLQSYRVIPYAHVEPDWAERLATDITRTLKEVLKAPTKWVLPVFLQEREVKDQPTVPHVEKRLSSVERGIERLQAELRTKAPAAQYPGLGPADLNYHLWENSLRRPLGASTLRQDAAVNFLGSLGRDFIDRHTPAEELGTWRIGEGAFGGKPEDKTEK